MTDRQDKTSEATSRTRAPRGALVENRHKNGHENGHENENEHENEHGNEYENEHNEAPPRRSTTSAGLGSTLQKNVHTCMHVHVTCM